MESGTLASFAWCFTIKSPPSSLNACGRREGHCFTGTATFASILTSSYSFVDADSARPVHMTQTQLQPLLFVSPPIAAPLHAVALVVQPALLLLLHLVRTHTGLLWFHPVLSLVCLCATSKTLLLLFHPVHSLTCFGSTQ